MYLFLNAQFVYTVYAYEISYHSTQHTLTFLDNSSP